MTAAEFIRSKPALLFDLFHTLTAKESIWPNLPSTSEILGLPSEEWNRQLLEKSRDRLIGQIKDPVAIIERMAHSIDPNLPMTVIEKAARNRIARFENALISIPDRTVMALKRLRAAGKKICLISNADAMEIAGWRKSPICDLFECAVFSCDVGFAKPDKEIYEIGLKRIHQTPENAVFIGDGGSNELYGAKQVGLSTVMVAGVIREIWPEQIDAHRKDADYIIEEIDELIDWN